MKITLSGDHRSTYGDEPRYAADGSPRYPLVATYDPDTNKTRVYFATTNPEDDQ